MNPKTVNTFDFRYIGVIPVILGLCLMAFPMIFASTFFEMLPNSYGFIGFILYALVVICILRFNRLPSYYLARIFFPVWKMNEQFVVVEIEPLSTYNKFKIIPDDIGVIYKNGNSIELETLREIVDITEEIKSIEWIASEVNPNSKLVSIKIGTTGQKLVLKPIYNKISFKIHKDAKLSSEWMIEKIHSWCDSHVLSAADQSQNTNKS